jgi:hypothetical protein
MLLEAVCYWRQYVTGGSMLLEAVCYSEMLVSTCESILRQNPEEHRLSHRREILNCYTKFIHSFLFSKYFTEVIKN